MPAQAGTHAPSVMPAQAGTHARCPLLYAGGWRFVRWLLIVSVVIKRVHAETGVDPDLRRDDEMGGDAAAASG